MFSHVIFIEGGSLYGHYLVDFQVLDDMNLQASHSINPLFNNLYGSGLKNETNLFHLIWFLICYSLKNARYIIIGIQAPDVM